MAPTFSAVLELFAFLVTLCAAGAFTKLQMTSLVRASPRRGTWGFRAPRAASERHAPLTPPRARRLARYSLERCWARR